MKQNSIPIYSLADAREFVETNRTKVDGTFRNHFHLMPPVGWMNDPNGFIYYRGEYHLFYQFFPYEAKWGPMHWGHAKSKDLIHWEELPIALAPDESYDRDGCFSGSAIEKDGNLYLMYTGHRIENEVVYQTQCMAISEDGINFMKYKNNPVIDEHNIGEHGDIHDFRDPKVIEKDGRYYTIVASKTKDDRGLILLYQSDDLFEWTFFSVLLEGDTNQGVMWECPDLFELDGKNVLILSPIEIKKRGEEFHNINSTLACIGEMNWESGTFTVENNHEIDFGLDFYAPQTTSDFSGRRLMIAWMQMWGRTMPTDLLGHNWAGSMTLARELRVEDNRLCQKPVSNVYDYLVKNQVSSDIVIDNEILRYDLASQHNHYYHIKLNLEHCDEVRIFLAKNRVGGLVISYDKENKSISFSRKNFGYSIEGSEPIQLTERKVSVNKDEVDLEVFMDTSSVELFVNQEKTMTFNFYETTFDSTLSFDVTGSLELLLLELGCVNI